MSSNDPFNLPPHDHGKHGRDINGRIMISAIIFLLLMVWFVFLLHVYARWFWRQPARISSQRSASGHRQFHFTGQEPARLLNVGLDSAVLRNLPMFVYKSKNFTDELECAVCLSKFEENEKGRLLPNCRHTFHVECIDMWFLSHSTCPLCRTGAQPEQPVLEFARMGQISNTIIGPITSGIHDNLNSEQRHSIASSGEEYNLQNSTNIFLCSSDRQKQMNDQGTSGGRRSLRIPQIGIEIPERPDGFSWPGDDRDPHQANWSQSSSKSPVHRLHSLTRMSSRDREWKVFPSDRPASENCDAENNGTAQG